MISFVKLQLNKKILIYLMFRCLSLKKFGPQYRNVSQIWRTVKKGRRPLP